MAKLVTTDRLEYFGNGFIEIWLPVEDDIPNGTLVMNCAWTNGRILDNDGYVQNEQTIKDYYNKSYGFRVWDARPTEEEKQNERWIGDIQPEKYYECVLNPLAFNFNLA